MTRLLPHEWDRYGSPAPLDDPDGLDVDATWKCPAEHRDCLSLDTCIARIRDDVKSLEDDAWQLRGEADDLQDEAARMSKALAEVEKRQPRPVAGQTGWLS